jgi:hypothetical protein
MLHCETPTFNGCNTAPDCLLPKLVDTQVALHALIGRVTGDEVGHQDIRVRTNELCFVLVNLRCNEAVVNQFFWQFSLQVIHIDSLVPYIAVSILP